MSVDERRKWPWDAGLRWAFFMLALEVGECLALTEVIFSDQRHLGTGDGSRFGGWLGIYFLAVLTTLVLQMVGIALVVRGSYRLGGVLQIVASTLHVSKIEGLIGIVGGLKALKHGSSPMIESGDGWQEAELDSDEAADEPRRVAQAR